MIVIATHGDPTADVLNGYARALVARLGEGIAIWLSGPQATAEAIAHTLESHPRQAVFLFGHGVSPPGTGFLGSCGRIALDVSRIHWFLADRVVVGSFCDGQQVGAHAVRVGFSMFGYRGRLAVPLWPEYAARMTEAVLAGPLHIAQGGHVDAAVRVASQAYARTARELYKSSSWGDFMAAVVISSNDPTHW